MSPGLREQLIFHSALSNIEQSRTIIYVTRICLHGDVKSTVCLETIKQYFSFSMEESRFRSVRWSTGNGRSMPRIQNMAKTNNKYIIQGSLGYSCEWYFFLKSCLTYLFCNTDVNCWNKILSIIKNKPITWGQASNGIQEHYAGR